MAIIIFEGKSIVRVDQSQMKGVWEWSDQHKGNAVELEIVQSEREGKDCWTRI